MGEAWRGYSRCAVAFPVVDSPVLYLPVLGFGTGRDLMIQSVILMKSFCNASTSCNGMGFTHEVSPLLAYKANSWDPNSAWCLPYGQSQGLLLLAFHPPVALLPSIACQLFTQHPLGCVGNYLHQSMVVGKSEQAFWGSR